MFVCYSVCYILSDVHRITPYICCWSLILGIRLYPDRLHFFRYENVTFTCIITDASHGKWTLKRNTSYDVNEECKPGWGVQVGSSCIINDLYPSDTGFYWCQSEDGLRTEAVKMTVTGIVLTHLVSQFYFFYVLLCKAEGTIEAYDTFVFHSNMVICIMFQIEIHS